MFEFIVSGRFPGTSIQITFGHIINIVFIVIAFGLILYELHIHNIHLRKPKLQDIINRLSL